MVQNPSLLLENNPNCFDVVDKMSISLYTLKYNGYFVKTRVLSICKSKQYFLVATLISPEFPWSGYIS